MSEVSNYGPELFRVADVVGNTEEWHQWRKARALTTAFASNAAAVLNVGKFKPRNRRELYLAKHGLLQDRAVQSRRGARAQVRARGACVGGVHRGAAVLPADAHLGMRALRGEP